MTGGRSYDEESGSYDGSDDGDSNDINLEGKFEARGEHDAIIKGYWYQTKNKSKKEDFEYIYVGKSLVHDENFKLENADIPKLYSGTYKGFIMYNDEKIQDNLELTFTLE